MYSPLQKFEWWVFLTLMGLSVWLSKALLPVGPVPTEALQDYEELVLKYCHVRSDLSSLQQSNHSFGDKGVGILFCFHHPINPLNCHDLKSESTMWECDVLGEIVDGAIVSSWETEESIQTFAVEQRMPQLQILNGMTGRTSLKEATWRLGRLVATEFIIVSLC